MATKLLGSLIGGAIMMTTISATAANAQATTGTAPLNPAATADRAATLLESRYVTPALGARYAAALRSHAARGDYATLTDPAALAARITADLQAVATDGHLRVYHVDPTPLAPPAAAPTTATEGARSVAPGIRATRWIEPGVAYIAFEHFDDRPEAIAAFRRFLADHAGARALVIDSRGNHGGAFDMMGILANHLFATPRRLANMDMARAVVDQHGAPFPIDGQSLKRTDGPAGLVRFEHWAVPAGDRAWSTIPVYYLTSHDTFSAAEHMAMVLKSTGRATLVGETTGGGNHFGGTEPIGPGMEMFVPVGHTTDPLTGRDWEGVGVAPDVAVPAATALDEALRRIHASTAKTS